MKISFKRFSFKVMNSIIALLVIRYLVPIAFPLIFLLSCSNKNLEPAEYIEWYNENPEEFMTSEKAEGFSFELKFEPTDYIILKESEGHPDSEFSKKRRSELKGYTIFSLRIKTSEGTNLFTHNIASEEEAFLRQTHFNSMVDQDFLLVTDSDTIPCALALLEENNGISPFSVISLSFPISNSSLGDNACVIYDDKVLGTGKIRFCIDDLNELPTLKEIE